MEEKRTRPNGFTLIELIVVMGIAGLMLGIGLPYFGAITRRARVETEARTISISLLQARMQAIKRGRNVCVEFSTDSTKASYHKPIVYVDNPGAGTAGVYDGADTLISTSEIASGSAKDKFLIDAADTVAPSTAGSTIEFIFTPFGALAATSTAQSMYVGDTRGNIMQIAIGTRNTGKLSTTKLSGSSYVAPPWAWS
jgi:prepilin-type N-terminal cleavage/methylation domain-containing protein